MINMIKAIYQNVLACVRVNSDSSDLFDVTLGLKQGEPLSPLQFLLFVNDAFMDIRTDDIGVMINHLCVFMMMFSDDMIICATTKQGLQTLLDHLSTYSDKWGLNVNTRKTKICVFETRKIIKTIGGRIKVNSWKLLSSFVILV